MMNKNIKYPEERRAEDFKRRLKRMVSDRKLVEQVVERALKNKEVKK